MVANKSFTCFDFEKEIRQVYLEYVDPTLKDTVSLSSQVV